MQTNNAYYGLGVLVGLVLVGLLVWAVACGSAAVPAVTPTPVPTVPAGYQRLCFVTDVRVSCSWCTGANHQHNLAVEKDVECVIVQVWRD